MLFLPHFGFVVFLTITYDNVTSSPRVHCVTRSHCLSNNNVNHLQKKSTIPPQTSAFLIKSFLTLDYNRNPHYFSCPFLSEGLNCDLRKRWVSSFFSPLYIKTSLQKNYGGKRDCTIVFIRVLFCLFYFLDLSFGVSLSKSI